MTTYTQFPTLSSFLVLSTNPNSHTPPDNYPKQDSSDPAPLPPSVLYFFHSKRSLLTSEKRNRLVGLVQGILNFTSVLTHGLQHNPSTQSDLRVINCASQKMIFVHPEPGFHLCAVIKLPERSTQAAQDSSKLPNTLNLLSQSPSPQSPYQPSEEVLFNSLCWAAQEFCLLNGSLISTYHKDQKLLGHQLEKFWSVWLWRWNVGKTGCGAIDFDEFFGHLESPFLKPPLLPKIALDTLNQFINCTCPTYPVLPILIYNHNILYLPSPTEPIKKEEIQALARYLLSLLGGSEAKPICKQQQLSNPALNGDQDKNNRTTNIKKLSGLTLDTILNFPPKLQSISQPFDSQNSWAHKALSWASTSLVIPANHSNSNPSDVDSLDHQLRAGLGLSTKAQPQVLSVKSVPSIPQLSTDLVLSPTPLISQDAGAYDLCSTCEDNIMEQLPQQISCSKTTKIGYPENLLLIYAPKEIKTQSSHYPHNLMNLYDNSLCQEDQLDHSDSINQLTGFLSPCGLTKAEPRRKMMNQSVNLMCTTSPTSTSIDLKHNPRSSDFNVEHALADAMSEYSIGTIANLDVGPNRQLHKNSLPATTSLSPLSLNITGSSNPTGKGQINHHSHTHNFITNSASWPASASTNDSTMKHMKIYVNGGKLETDVIWIQYEDWSMALVLNQFNHIYQQQQQTPFDEDKQLGFLVRETRSVLKSLIESGWLASSLSCQEPTPNSSSPPILKNLPPPSSNQRYLIRNTCTGIFHKQSSEKSSWLLKNQIWPGKIVPPIEVEVSHALLKFFSNNTSESGGQCHFKSAWSLEDTSSEPGRICAKQYHGIVEEGFLRTNSGQWVIFKKSHQRQGQSQELMEADRGGGRLEIFLVLPSGSGTLIEADHELRILERQSEEIKFSIL